VRLLRRANREPAPFREADAYERLHGERTGEIVRVEPAPPRKPIPHRNGDLSGELLRRAFESKLDGRDAT
jgi:hypothetical protein